jgi:trimeric autotransporter adhesin
MKDLHTLFSAFAVTALIFVLGTGGEVFAALSCSVTTTCNSPSVVVFRMSAVSNAHAELASQSNYPQLVCCSASGASLSNTCSGTFATAVKLISTTNSHVQENNGTATNPACLSVGSGFTVSVGYQSTNCTGFDTTLASLSSGSGNSHVGDSSSYTTKVCASVVANSLTFVTDSSSETFPSHTPGVLVATSTILSVTTSNTSGFSVSVQRADGTGTMSLGGLGSTYIPDKTSWSAGVSTTTSGNATASTTQPSTLQFRVRFAGTDTANYAISWWGSNDTTAQALFAGIPSSSQQIINRSTSAVSPTISYVLYNLNTPVSQKTGTYTGDITYTTTSNP